MAGRRVGFARWRSGSPSGGNRYDDELAPRLRGLGIDLRDHLVTGPWPRPAPGDRDRFATLLDTEPDWLVDNIVGSAAPDALAAATRAGRRITLLIHYFPADQPGLAAAERDGLVTAEAAAVRAADRVVVTSAWAAGQLSARYGRGDAVVAVPGVDPAPLAAGAPAGGPPALLWLGALTATKDPLTLVEALADLRDLPWTARLVGPDGADRRLAGQVRDRVAQTGLAARVQLTGARTGQALDAVWHGTDLLVHTARAETYAMVVGEALARGIASVVATGTGAVEAQGGVGGGFPPGDAAALADVLRGWLTDPALRSRWRSAAAGLRPLRPTWDDTARVVAEALAG